MMSVSIGNNSPNTNWRSPVTSRYLLTAIKYQSVPSHYYIRVLRPWSRKRLGSMPSLTLAAKGGIFRILIATGAQAQTRQADHGIAAPVGKPMVAGDDRLEIFATVDDKLIGSQREFTE